MRRYPTVVFSTLFIQLNMSLKVGKKERENEFDWVSVGSVRLVTTENGARKPRLPPRTLFNQPRPVRELSADCCQSLHHSHFVFRGKDDM